MSTNYPCVECGRPLVQRADGLIFGACWPCQTVAKRSRLEPLPNFGEPLAPVEDVPVATLTRCPSCGETIPGADLLAHTKAHRSARASRRSTAHGCRITPGEEPGAGLLWDSTDPAASHVAAFEPRVRRRRVATDHKLIQRC